MVRRAIQHSPESLAKVAKRYDLNPKTVAKWKKRSHGHDAPMGPKPCHSTVLTLEAEGLSVACRRPTLLPLDDCLYALQATLPHLTRSALHRCLQRPGISRLPDTVGEKSAKKRFKSYPIGSFHIASAEVHTEAGQLSRFVAIDRACKVAYPELPTEANKMVAAQVLRSLIAALPDKIHTVLTDHGIQLTNRTRDIYALHPIFDRVCHEYGIDHRLPKTTLPGRMVR